MLAKTFNYPLKIPLNVQDQKTEFLSPGAHSNNFPPLTWNKTWKDKWFACPPSPFPCQMN